VISSVVRRTRATLLTSLATTLLAASPAMAQRAEPAGIPAYRSLVGFNPLGIPFDVASVEFETLVDQGITFGVAGSYVMWDDDDGGSANRFTSVDLKGRYYPGEVALRDFSVGLSLGLTNYSERVYDYNACNPTPTNPNPCPNGIAPSRRESLVTPTIGVLVDYNFMLGAERRFVVGTGIGAKRLLKHSRDVEGFDPPRAYPFGRFAIGLAF
jgi:hypothetical protein